MANRARRPGGERRLFYGGVVVAAAFVSHLFNYGVLTVASGQTRTPVAPGPMAQLHGAIPENRLTRSLPYIATRGTVSPGVEGRIVERK
jgi:hypothetical protein